jgi:hypothetical protein
MTLNSHCSEKENLTKKTKDGKANGEPTINASLHNQ